MKPPSKEDEACAAHILAYVLEALEHRQRVKQYSVQWNGKPAIRSILQAKRIEQSAAHLMSNLLEQKKIKMNKVQAGLWSIV